MATIKLGTYGNSTLILVTEISSLANGSTSGITGSASGTPGTAYDNTNNLYPYADFELFTVFQAAPTYGNTLTLYWDTSLDGNNYEVVTPAGTSVPAPPRTVGSFFIDNTNTSQRLHLWRVPLMSGKMKFQLTNNSGVSVGSTSSFVAIYPYALTVA